jgi:hypothetical protein
MEPEQHRHRRPLPRLGQDDPAVRLLQDEGGQGHARPLPAVDLRRIRRRENRQRFGDSRTGLYNALVAGTKVVVAGSGPESVDMKAYLTDLKSACGCGEVLEAHA